MKLMLSVLTSVLVCCAVAEFDYSGDMCPVIIATYTKKAVVIDGKLDEEMWAKTPMYYPQHALTAWDNATRQVQAFFRQGVVEPGIIRLLWDNNYLYVSAEFTDSDIVAEDSNDQTHHYLTGDVSEVFLKPMNQTWYWEMYMTPGGNKTAFFFPGRGRLGLPSGFPKEIPFKDMKVGASCDGSLNNPWDKDRKWCGEMAIPIAEVNKIGEKLSPKVPWLIFFGRYNYSRYLPKCENTSYPKQETINYHQLEEYGRLKLVK